MIVRFKSAFLAFLLPAAGASAIDMWTNSISGETSAYPPRRPADVVGAPLEWFVEPGWVRFSLAQQADYDAAQAAEAESAAAQAEALAGPPPEIFVPALDDSGNLVGTARLVVRASTWELVPLTNSASPQRIWAVQKSEFTNKIARADRKKEAIRAAKDKGNGLSAVAGRVNALESERGIE